MKTITAAASVLRTAYNGASGWRDAGSAYQGSWNGGSSRVGAMLFDGLGTELLGMDIKSITLTANIEAGTNKTDRTLTFYSSNYQEIDTSKDGADYIGSKLGEIVGNGDTGIGEHTYTLDSTSHAELFRAMAAYLAAGNICILLYNGETAKASGYSYSANYLCCSRASLTIEYDNGGSFVYYNENGTSTKCEVHRCTNGEAVKCEVYYNDNGTAVKV